MHVDVLLGLQWGDEGKGKIVDILTPDYDIIARFQGGPNAGHTLVFNNKKYILHTIPSGIFRDNAINIIGNGVVMDPVIFKEELESLNLNLNTINKRLYISKKAHLILPTHRILDAASEHAKGKTKIGSTLKGIGPTYMDKTGRNGIRLGDILSNDFADKYKLLKEKHFNFLKLYDYSFDLSEYEKKWFDCIDFLKNLNLIDSEQYINEQLTAGKNILAEGAQGTLLDIDFGTYPYVTSSNTVSAGACTGLGIAPNKINKVYGIVKAYCTRVGSGPFPTELNDETGQQLQSQGNEFGSTTGRARRCGWLDLVALKYSVMINGVTEILLTKTDVLDNFDTIKVCTAYNISGKTYNYLPYDCVNKHITPVYQTFKGWKKDLSKIMNNKDLPDETLNYIKFIEKETGVKVSYISVGPDREQIIKL
ncbi:MAG: adenylosuccinate synthase [Marinilabiliales bacterium]